VKPGDKVMCLKTFVCIMTDKQEFTVGKVYIVKQVVANTLYVEVDDQGMTDNGWMVHNFQLVQ
jgi:hypothetical protein